jgi:hypothetical protein
MTEKWKDIPFCEGTYQISNKGRVKGIGPLTRKRILKPVLDRRGYPRIRLKDNSGNKRSFRVHRLVAQVFISNPLRKEQVNHIDGVKTNNVITNLEWVSNEENQKHAMSLGIHASQRTGKAALRYKSGVKVFKDGKHILTMHGNADMLSKGFDPRNVHAVIKGLRKTHHGCTFERE